MQNAGNINRIKRIFFFFLCRIRQTSLFAYFRQKSGTLAAKTGKKRHQSAKISYVNSIYSKT